MSIEVRNRYTKKIILVVDSANLESANLESANLESAYLRDANLRSANLIGANLMGANLMGANLMGANLICIGDMKYIRTMQIDTYQIGFTKDYLQIGNMKYTIKEWREFTKEVSDEMDIPMLGWWSKWKEVIFKIIELSGVEQ